MIFLKLEIVQANLHLVMKMLKKKKLKLIHYQRLQIMNIKQKLEINLKLQDLVNLAQKMQLIISVLIKQIEM